MLSHSTLSQRPSCGFKPPWFESCAAMTVLSVVSNKWLLLCCAVLVIAWAGDEVLAEDLDWIGFRLFRIAIKAARFSSPKCGKQPTSLASTVSQPRRLGQCQSPACDTQGSQTSARGFRPDERRPVGISDLRVPIRPYSSSGQHEISRRT